MTAYRTLLRILDQAPTDSWKHHFGYSFSTCTVNGVDMTLYRCGWVSFAGKMYGEWPLSWRGRKLFKKIRPINVPYDQSSLERAELEKMGFSEE